MRLINADELVKNLEEALKINPPKDRQKFLFQVGAVKILEGIINEAEERFTDAVEVVRCKECKHSVMTTDGQVKYCKNHDPLCRDKLYYDADFFCADGDRKEVTE